MYDLWRHRPVLAAYRHSLVLVVTYRHGPIVVVGYNLWKHRLVLVAYSLQNLSHDCASSDLDSNISLNYCSADLDPAKSTLKITEFKRFQVECISGIKQGKDVVVVETTGCGKSMCFVLPAILNPGKISLVIEP